MGRKLQIVLIAASVLVIGGGAMSAEQRGGRGTAPSRAGAGRPPPPRNAEPHPGPTGYHRMTEPQGWNARPASVNPGAYNHNYKAARSFSIGPYHRPAGWAAHRWAYGQILPRAYWAQSYVLADYWLFALEVPPAGCEWVRDDDDAILVDTSTGQIIQVEYGVFS
jgi:Ni/Co efflux regulator RcnB